MRQLLHKRKLDCVPSHILLGQSVESQAMADLRIPWLLKIPARHFLSVEPLIAPVDLSPWMRPANSQQTHFEYWEAESFRLLLSNSETIRREHWVSIFCWEVTHIFDEQIDAFLAYRRCVDWEVPNVGQTFLVEANTLLARRALPTRRMIISKLLSVGADPEPLLKSAGASKLPEEVRTELMLTRERRKRKEDAMNDDAMETDLQLI